MDIALIGVDKIARDQHIPAIMASEDWTLAATLSHEGSVNGVSAFTDLEEVLRRCPGIGAVSLCVPPRARFSYAAAALAAGRHVMLEKPPGATLSECRTLDPMAGRACRLTAFPRQKPKGGLRRANIRPFTPGWPGLSRGAPSTSTCPP